MPYGHATDLEKRALGYVYLALTPLLLVSIELATGVSRGIPQALHPGVGELSLYLLGVLFLGSFLALISVFDDQLPETLQLLLAATPVTGGILVHLLARTGLLQTRMPWVTEMYWFAALVYVSYAVKRLYLRYVERDPQTT